MVKLLLQESGTVRAFRLGDGVVSVGSGEAASLRVQSGDVAELHFEIEVRGESASVRPMPGVLPLSIDGEPCSAEASLGLRTAVQVGGLVLWIDSDDSTSTVSPLQRIKPKGASGKGPSNAKGHFPPVAKGPRENPKANYRGKQRVVESQRRTVKRGLPNAVLVGGPLLVVVIAFLVFSKGVKDSNKSAIRSVSAMLDVVEQKLKSSSINDAERELARVLPSYERTKEDEARILDIEGRLKLALQEEREAQANLAGSKFLDVYLKRYEKDKLKGDPTPARIRLFLKRTQEFRRRWPKHQQMAWVDRMEQRFEGTVDIHQPPSLDDITWEIKFIDIGENRNYKLAFELIEDLATRIGEDEKDKLERLRLRVIAARDEHFRERMEKVDSVLRNYDSVVKPVNWLLHLVLWSNDEGLSEKAAYKLISLEGADACLRGYEAPYPELYNEILAHPVVRDYARKQGILQ